MARKKIKNDEVIEVTREHDGVKITTVGIRWARKIQTAPYESADAEVSLWADVESVDDMTMPDVIADLWQLARSQVHAQLADPTLAGAIRVALPSTPPPGPKPAAKSAAANPALPQSGGRERVHRAQAFGKDCLTAGVTTDTLGELLDVGKRFEELVGKDAVRTEQADLCPDAWVVKDGQRVYTRLALTEEEGKRLLKHLQLVIETTKKAGSASK
jgi:hypothetical protein